MKTEDLEREAWVQAMEQHVPEWKKKLEEIRKKYSKLKNSKPIGEKFQNVWINIIKEYRPVNISIGDWLSFINIKNKEVENSLKKTTSLQELMNNPEYKWEEDDRVDWPAGRWVKK